MRVAAGEAAAWRESRPYLATRARLLLDGPIRALAVAEERLVTAGTGSGRRQSSLLVPVPSAEGLVGAARRKYDPVAIAGVPAHVTLVVPWVPPDKVTEADLADLDAALAGEAAFGFSLASVRRFGRRVLWLEPVPSDPFRRLTNALARRYGTPPWEDEFDEVIPHLTVAHESTGADLDALERQLAPNLPLRCRAEEVWVMDGDGTSWQVRHRCRLATSPASAPGISPRHP